MFIHTPGVALPTRPRRVKTNSAASGIYCTITIINHTDLFNFFIVFLYSFYVSLKCVIMQYHVSWKSLVCMRAYMHTLIYT